MMNQDFEGANTQQQSRIERLNWLAFNYDPSEKPSEKVVIMLKEFGIDLDQEHPFSITNKLLQLIDSEQNQDSKINEKPPQIQ